MIIGSTSVWRLLAGMTARPAATSDGDEAHLLGDLALARVVELAEVGVAAGFAGGDPGGAEAGQGADGGLGAAAVVEAYDLAIGEAHLLKGHLQVADHNTRPASVAGLVHPGHSEPSDGRGP
jgi:hypothetical protein